MRTYSACAIFFFQAEDGIRDPLVTGVQTCALPILPGHGRLGTVETLRGQRAYLHDMLSQVGAGIKAGRTADQLANEIDLSRHQPFGAGRMENASSVRAMYRRLVAMGTGRN